MQVVFMTGTREQLMDRARHRFVDYDANYQPFHVPPSSVASSGTKMSPAKMKVGKESETVVGTAVSSPVLPQTTSGALLCCRNDFNIQQNVHSEPCHEFFEMFP